MRTETAKAIEDGAKVLTATTGIGTSAGTVLGFLNGNAPAIGLLLTVFFGLLGLHYQRKQSRAEDELRQVKDSYYDLQRRLEEMERSNRNEF